MILKVLPHTRQVLDHINAQLLQMVPVPYTRKLEQLRRINRPTAEDDLVGIHPTFRPFPLVFHPSCGFTIKKDPGGKGAGTHIKVLTIQHWV